MRVASCEYEPAVVGDEDERPVVGLQALDQGVDRLQVEMVGRPRRAPGRWAWSPRACRRPAAPPRRPRGSGRSFSRRRPKNSTIPKLPRTKPIGSPAPTPRARPRPSACRRRSIRGGPARSSRDGSRNPRRSRRRSASVSFMTIFRSVDLPMPLGPMMAILSPRWILSETSFRTCFSPYAFETPSIASTSRPLAAPA